ncbi:ketosteroid isomerase-like protein [Nocardia sp. GAS34]|uniref:nuclear transport factor 2 family protein n=1 Tax=unclassified Nocardia TaxID=2637762 RepID=UPI003D25D9E6
MPNSTDVVKAFYRAAQQHDAAAILAVLHPDFDAHVAPGMPCAAGGSFHGPQQALTRIWGAVFRDFDTAPYDEEWYESGTATIVVTGHYRGTARATGRHYEAEFAHLWRVTDGRIRWLHQYTDTARWHEALTGA